MKFKSFQEYLTGKNKLDKVKVQADGDRITPEKMPNKPPKGGKPYKCSDGKPKMSKEKGFGDLGDTKYEPDVKNVHGKKPAKIPTVEQMQAATAVAHIAGQDPSFLENMIRALKEKGLLGVLVAEVLQQSESYKHIAGVMSHETYGPRVCNGLARALNETIAPPYAGELGANHSEEDDFQVDDDHGEAPESEDPNADPMAAGGPMPGAPGDPAGMTNPNDPMQAPPGAGGTPPPPVPGGPGDPTAMGPMGPQATPPNPLMGPPGAPPPGAPSMTKFQRAMMRHMMRK